MSSIIIRVKVFSSACLTSLAVLSPSIALGNPSSPHSTKGDVSFQQINKHTLEVSASDRSIINWSDFSIAKGETTRFIQPSSSSTVLNRVTGGGKSELFGRLEANGRVYLINPNGVMFGKEGVIQTAGFIASTLNLSDDAFLKGGTLNFKGDSKEKIVNLGHIESTEGDIFLVAYQVENKGNLSAKEGTVGLGSALEVMIKPAGKERLFIRTKTPLEPYAPDQKPEETALLQTGKIEALKAELKADGNPFKHAIQQKGVVEATGVQEINGVIYLVGDEGAVELSGALSAKNEGGIGGEIQLFGKDIVVKNGSLINISGDFGGGSLLIGGEFQGVNSPHKNAETVKVEKGAVIDANAYVYGNGGTAIVWSDNATAFSGTLYAEGGSKGGQGGFVEVSGAHNLNYKGRVHLLAPYGRTGTLLLDPTTITISANPEDPTVSFNNGTAVFSPSSTTNVNINYMSLVMQLLTGNVLLSTGDSNSGAAGAGDININAPISWPTNTSLTLSAYNDINVNANIGGNNMTKGSIIMTADNGNIHVNNASIFADKSTSSQTNITLTALKGDILIESTSNPVKVGTPFGDVTVSAPSGNVTLKAGNTASASAIIGNITGTSSGNITVQAGKDLNIEAGTAIGAIAAITRLGGLNQSTTSATGDILVDVGGNLFLKGGSKSLAQAYIGHGGHAGASSGLISGKIDINVGKGMKMTGGLGANAFIGTSANANYTGDIHLAIGKTLLMQSGESSQGQGSFIGADNNPVFTRQQNLYITVGENLILDARGGSPVTIQPIFTPTNSGQTGVIDIRVGKDVSMIAGDAASSHAGIFLYSPKMQTKVHALGNIRTYNGTGADAIFPIPSGENTDLGSLDVRASGNIILGGGNDTQCPIHTNCFSASGDIYFQADAGFSSGSLWNPKTVILSADEGNIFSGSALSVNSVNSPSNKHGGFAIDTASYSSDFPATLEDGFVSASSPKPPASISLVSDGTRPIGYKSEGSIFILSAPVFNDATTANLTLGSGANQLELLAKENITIGSLPDMTSLLSGGFTNIYMNGCGFSCPPSSTEHSEVIGKNILMVADNNIVLNANSCIKASEAIQLVVDNGAPQRPNVGSGGLIENTGVMDAPSISIYTAKPAQNQINDLASTDQVFSFYFTDPETTHTKPVVYYKVSEGGNTPEPPVTPTTLLLGARPEFELFLRLHGSDEFTGWENAFDVSYNKKLFNKEYGNKGLTSSFTDDPMLFHVARPRHTTSLLTSEEKKVKSEDKN